MVSINLVVFFASALFFAEVNASLNALSLIKYVALLEAIPLIGISTIAIFSEGSPLSSVIITIPSFALIYLENSVLSFSGS